MDTAERDKAYSLIEEHFPDAIMNAGPEFMDIPHQRYDLTSILGFCGCGDPQGTAKWLVELLEGIAARPRDGAGYYKCFRKAFGDDFRDSRAAEFAVYQMDDREWIDHGTSWTGSWITDKGRAVIAAAKFEATDTD